MDFDTEIERILGNEGGYVNDPQDPGGETQWGITWPVLREAIGSTIVPPDTTIKSLNRVQAKLIYKWRFWDRGQMDLLPPAIAFQVLDFAVNSGIETAIRKLQAAVGVADDGHVGPVTLAAIAAKPVPVVIMLFVAQRIRFWTKLKNWGHDGAGWANRAAADLEYGAKDIA